MPTVDEHTLLEEIKVRGDRVRRYIADDGFVSEIIPAHLRDATGDYLARGGKSLRPAVLLFCCGAVGGEEEWALPAAAAVEVTHNWTLIHDDIIDRDELRRGKPSAHVAMAEASRTEWRYPGGEADHYGISMALLGGDMGQCWAVHLLGNLREVPELPLALPGRIIEGLIGYTVPKILEGEALDVQFAGRSISSLSSPEIEDMLVRKTGELYRFCGYAGGLIGVRAGGDIPAEVEALAEFAGLCGAAFQYVDDTLGFLSDDDKLGKSAASDLREGKRTAVVLHGYENATEAQREFIDENLGARDASDEVIEELRGLFVSLGAVEYVKRLAQDRYESALARLEEVRESRYRELLAAWAEFLISRSS
ncbi:MAG: polyprenyl synthetase family protein [Candidatus Coatesbacteria bacterium]|nr:MAG: polyprenyl synthetase family protein [Candidatus Coatesbacteria bacterium]